MMAWANLTETVIWTALGLPVGVLIGLAWMAVKPRGRDRNRAGG